jgi:hypothetical protein
MDHNDRHKYLRDQSKTKNNARDQKINLAKKLMQY